MIKLKCNESLKRNFTNLFDYEILRCNECNSITYSKVGFIDIFYITTNSVVDLISKLNKLEIKKHLVYLAKDEFLYHDLIIYQKLDIEKLIIIEEKTCLQ